MFRFGRSRNQSTWSSGLCYFLVMGRTRFVSREEVLSGYCRCISLIFSSRTFRDEHRTIYLGAYYPIFHRTSVTKRRLLILLAILLISTTVLHIISNDGLVISSQVSLIILMALFLPPFIFVNFKLFVVARKVCRERAVSPGNMRTKNLKNISAALWVVACLMLLYIPTSINIAFNLAEKSLSAIRLSYIWMFTCIAMNCILNSLIFFWKNKVLRTEGMKILKALKDRLVGSQTRT